MYYNRFTADFGNFSALPVKCPTANFTSAHNVFHELYTTAKPNRKLVEKFNVLEEIVVGVPGSRKYKTPSIYICEVRVYKENYSISWIIRQ